MAACESCHTKIAQNPMDVAGLFPHDELDSPEFLAAIALTAPVAGAEEHCIEQVRKRNPS